MLDRLPRVSPQAYRYITLVTVASLVLVTLAGAIVRLTGSGLGCETWPSCEDDSFTPRTESGMHAMIEFGNRLVSGVVGLVAAAAIYGAYRRTPRRRDLIQWSWQVLAWVMVNALVGAVVVEYDLLPATVVVHFLLAMAAVWSAVVLDHKASQPDDLEPSEEGALPTEQREMPSALLRASHLLLAASLVTIVLGTIVTAAGPHAGDEEAERLSVDVADVARFHGISAVALLALVLFTSWSAYRLPVTTVVMDQLRWLSLVVMGQGVLGYVQYFSDVPPLLVGAHVLGSVLLWIAVLRVWLALNEGRPTIDSQPTTRETGGDARSPNPGRSLAGQGRAG